MKSASDIFNLACESVKGLAVLSRAGRSRGVADKGFDGVAEIRAGNRLIRKPYVVRSSVGPDTVHLLSLLRRGSGRLTCLVASPAAGGELYSLALLDQACVRGGYSLAPEGMLVFEGMSAVEVLSSKAEMERVKTCFL